MDDGHRGEWHPVTLSPSTGSPLRRSSSAICALPPLEGDGEDAVARLWVFGGEDSPRHAVDNVMYSMVLKRNAQGEFCGTWQAQCKTVEYCRSDMGDQIWTNSLQLLLLSAVSFPVPYGVFLSSYPRTNSSSPPRFVHE